MIEIRPYQPQDQPAIQNLIDESHTDLPAKVPDGYFDDLKSIPSTFSGGAFLVATDTDTLVGTGGLLPTGEIVRMRVTPSHRRQGIASQILKCLIAKAQELGMTKLHLHTLTQQTPTQALYLSHGFQESARGQLHGNPVIAYELNL